MARAFIPQSCVDDAVLFELFLFAQDSAERLTVFEIGKIFPFKLSEKRIQLALENLIQKDFASEWRDHDDTYAIEAKGYAFVEESLQNSRSNLAKYAEYGPEWLQQQKLNSGGVPASDRVVNRSDNFAEFQEVENELAQLVEFVDSKDNEVGDKLGDQREVLKQEFSAANDAVQSGFFRVSSLLGWLSRALKFVMEKFSGTVIAESAKKLFDLLLGLI